MEVFSSRRYQLCPGGVSRYFVIGQVLCQERGGRVSNHKYLLTTKVRDRDTDIAFQKTPPCPWFRHFGSSRQGGTHSELLDGSKAYRRYNLYPVVCGHDRETFEKHPLLSNSGVRLIPLCGTQNTPGIPAVRIFALTRGFLAPRPGGQPGGCPIPLSCEIVLGLQQN